MTIERAIEILDPEFRERYGKDLMDEACRMGMDALGRMLHEPLKPIKTCTSRCSFGVKGVLIVGTCPECGQANLNNADNKFCGGCGKPLVWE